MGAVVVPFQGKKVAAAFASLNPQESNGLGEGIGSGYPIIGYKGSKWSLRYQGETKLFLRPDGSPTNALRMIILRTAPTKAKSYYPGGYDPDSSAGKRPTCGSSNAIVPDDDVDEKQAVSCHGCKRDAWYKNDKGRRTKDCNDFKRLAVLIHPDDTKAVLGKALMEPTFLRVPASSLQELKAYGDRMGRMGVNGEPGYHYSTYVTQITFDPEMEYPKFVFREIALLSDEEAPIILEMREDPICYRITGETGATQRAPAPSVTEAPKPLAIGAGLLAHTGNGGGVAEGEVIQPKVAPVQTAADTGVDESDDELDAQINAMLKKKH